MNNFHRGSSILVLLFFVVGLNVSAQNIPQSGNIPDIYLYNGSGTTKVFIPQLSDGDGNIDTVSLSASSDNEAMVSLGSISYNPENTFAIIELTAEGMDSSATITVTISDDDGSKELNFTATVGPYTNYGANFEIHDIIFWQQALPLDGIPVFDTVINSTEAPFDDIDFESLDITVNAIKDDFFTALFKGYIIPKVSGEYKFSIWSQDSKGVWLGSSIADAEPLAVRSTKHGDAGTTDPNNSSIIVSDPISLEAGKVYGFYGVQWIVHSTYGGIMWEGPGIERSYISAENLFTEYDLERPSAPGNLQLDVKGVNDLSFSWEASVDNKEILGYNIYLDGVLNNVDPTEDLEWIFDGLNSDQKYSIVVTCIDLVGNESLLSNILSVETYDTDTNPPSPPDQISLIANAGLALEIQWSGYSDEESAVNGFNIYVNGILYNSEGIEEKDQLIISGLSPETEYSISIEAIDAGGNVSELSSPFLFSTSVFDPLGENLGVKSGTFSFNLKPFSYSHGIGVNPNFKNGEVFNSTHEELFNELKPAGIRWGALTANPLDFISYIGAGKSVTIGKFMNLCNQNNALTVFCCGVKNSTDWMTDENTFAHFLEYIAGPAGTTYGDMRIAEGYPKSLLENSPGLIFEFGNEVWGGDSHNAEIGEGNYALYAQWCRDMATIMRNSPYYDSEKIKLAYSGRNPSPDNSYGVNDKLLVGDRGEVDMIALSGYLGGNLDYDPAIPTGDSELDYYKNAMVRVAQNIEGLNHYAKMSMLESDKIKPSYLYESNMTTSAYNGRQGQAIISTDYYLTTIEHGSVIPSIFHLTNGEWKITNPAENYKRLPLFISAALVNRFCKGYVLTPAYESSDKIYTSNKEQIDLDPVGCHAYHKDGSYTLVLSSRDFGSNHIVQIDLPDELNFNSSAKMYTIGSDGYSSREARVDSTELILEDGMFVSVPKYSMVFITFEGDDITEDSLPELGEYKYVASTKVEIKAAKYMITSNFESLELWANIDPDNVWVEAVNWELVDNAIGATMDVSKTICRLRGSGLCDGNGTLVLRASAVGNPEIFDEVEIEISGQKSAGCTNVEQVNSDMISLYPVPAKSYVNIQIPLKNDFSIEMYTASGKMLMEEKCYDGFVRISVEQFQKGFYFMKVNIDNKIFNKKFVLI